MPAPEACLLAFASDPRPVTKVPNAPVSNSLGLKKLGGGVTCVEDPTGPPPKVATACEANITTAKVAGQGDESSPARLWERPRRSTSAGCWVTEYCRGNGSS